MIQKVTIDLKVLDCPTCGMIHGVPYDVVERKMKDGKSGEHENDDDRITLYCPNGHEYRWFPKETKPDDDRLKELHAQEQLEAALAELSELKGKTPSPPARMSPQSNQTDATHSRVELRPTQSEDFVKCPLCDCTWQRRSAYAGPWVRRHMRSKHRWDVTPDMRIILPAEKSGGES